MAKGAATKWEICSECAGKGVVPGKRFRGVKCHQCQRSGHIEVPIASELRRLLDDVDRATGTHTANDALWPRTQIALNNVLAVHRSLPLVRIEEVMPTD